ncbi:Nucleotide-binding universal stress protein, UspA family [Arenibacter nanhaiticus]|uniref:Universal stress protein n=1 Tax=Arenibacter nanhaiticus TaxID=558155 RepID=A0A1M6DMI5_9FLAO|nr:universal stress protein [Arenibacter nanhaiticus]SHI74289.1 Nucleotide-binding universal stress protein, UspA family [Arenibacter nanhaiticus]
MKNILVAIDFNDNESILIEKAFQLAKAFGSKVWVLHIAAPDPEFVGYGVGPQYIRDSRAEELRYEHRKIQEHVGFLRNNKIDAEGLLIQGATIEMVIKESKKLNADLIVAGHHKHSFLFNAFIGSVSTQIMKKSKIPVLIIPLE